jgi:hypothetical protein
MQVSVDYLLLALLAKPCRQCCRPHKAIYGIINTNLGQQIKTICAPNESLTQCICHAARTESAVLYFIKPKHRTPIQHSGAFYVLDITAHLSQ